VVVVVFGWANGTFESQHDRGWIREDKSPPGRKSIVSAPNYFAAKFGFDPGYD
jgi:hypothetical protein